ALANSIRCRDSMDVVKVEHQRRNESSPSTLQLSLISNALLLMHLAFAVPHEKYDEEVYGNSTDT
ncbi:hypothetical protein KI387_013902, partial [Taxus chinensis]